MTHLVSTKDDPSEEEDQHEDQCIQQEEGRVSGRQLRLILLLQRKQDEAKIRWTRHEPMDVEEWCGQLPQQERRAETGQKRSLPRSASNTGLTSRGGIGDIQTRKGRPQGSMRLNVSSPLSFGESRWIAYRAPRSRSLSSRVSRSCPR